MLKLPKRFHPDFSNPKIKPTCPVEIDYSVAPKGTRIWFNGSRRLAGGAFTAQGDTYYKDNFFNFDGSGDYLDCGSDPIFQSEDFTLIAVCSDFVNVTSGSLCGQGGSSTTQGWVLRYDQSASSNKVGFTKLGVSDGKSSITCPFGEKNVVIAITFSGNNVVLCVNGQTDTISFGSAINAQTSPKFVIGAGWRNGVVNTPGNFKLHMLAAIPKNVSTARLVALAANPYSILKPANDFYYFTGAAAGGYTLTAEAGVFSLGSDPVNLTYAEILTAEAGVYSLGSDPVTLTYTPAGAYTLTADAGVFSLGSDPVNLLMSEVLVADPGVYSLGSDAVNLTYTPVSTLSAEPGVFTLGSDAINLTYAEILTAEAGVYTLGSSAVNLVLGILETPNCYTWLTSTITDVEWYSSLIDASPTYFISTINGDPTYVVSTIDGDDLYLIGDLC